MDTEAATKNMHIEVTTKHQICVFASVPVLSPAVVTSLGLDNVGLAASAFRPSPKYIDDYIDKYVYK